LATVGAQHCAAQSNYVAPLRRKSRVDGDLFDDNAHKFLFSGAKKKISWFAEIDIFPRIIDACPIDFHSALLD